MDGEAIKLYLFDFAEELDPELVKTAFKNPEDFSKIEYNLPTPEEIPQFTLPLVFNMKSAELQAGGEKVSCRVQIAVFSLGTVSVRIRIPLNGRDEQFLSKIAFSQEFEAQAYKLAQQVRAKVKNALQSRQVQVSDEDLFETYAFYYIKDTKANFKSKSLIAGLMVSEPNAGKMDDGYIKEILSNSISYYGDDAFFVGWDGAVLIDVLESIDYELVMAEIANMQLLKLRIYKKRTADMLASTGKQVEALTSSGFFARLLSSKASALSSRLSAFSDSLNEMLNRIDNTVFGLGEWYLSRIYALFANVFKLSELRRSIEADASKLSARRSIVADVLQERRNDMLEFVIIVLIVLEVIVEAAYLIK